MSSVPMQEDQRLRAEISEAHDNLGELDTSLRAIDGELESLGAQREQYELLERACGSLEKLDELGAAELFWGNAAGSRAADHIRKVRGGVAAFQQRIDEIEGRRHAVLDQIKQGQEVLDILEGDLSELEEQEERRRQEWVPERELVELPSRQAVMPWTRAGEDDSRFRRSLAASLLIALLLGSVVPWIELPLPELTELPEVPDRFARLIQEQPLPPAPEPVAEETPLDEEPAEPDPEPEPEEPVVAEETEAPETRDEPAPAAAEDSAPERDTRSAGILAFRENFSSLADSRPSAELGAQARTSTAGESAVGRTERSMVTTQEPGSSGGINLASLSRDVGGGGGADTEGVEVSRVASSIGGSGPSDRPLSGGAAAGRTDEEIQIVFDRYKSALYRLYNRELRNDPTLRGQIVLELTIEPDGSVSFCDVQSSDIAAPALEQQVVDRVRTFDFGAKDVPAVTIAYPIDFLPAG